MSRPEKHNHHKQLLLGLCLILLICTSPAQARSYPYQSCFEVAAAMHNVPVDLLLAVAATESNWDADARSHANAHGIMQIQWPGTARHLGVRRVAELYNPCLNISLGAKYLAELRGMFDNNIERALAAYNYGPTRIKQVDTLPEGAKRYVRKVQKHRRAVVAGTVPERLQAAQRLQLTSFDSRHRADKVATHLRQHLHGATVDVERRRGTALSGRYQIMLNIGSEGLTPGDQMLLNTLGLKL